MELAVFFLKLNKCFHVFSASMPGERLVVRDASEVGRFPGAAPPTRVELTIHKEGEKKEEGGGCRRWFRKAFPCCCKRQDNASYDVIDRVELVTPPTPAVLPEPPKPKPENIEAREMEGNIFRMISAKSPVNVKLLTQTQMDDKLQKTCLELWPECYQNSCSEVGLVPSLRLIVKDFSFCPSS